MFLKRKSKPLIVYSEILKIVMSCLYIILPTFVSIFNYFFLSRIGVIFFKYLPHGFSCNFRAPNSCVYSDIENHLRSWSQALHSRDTSLQLYLIKNSLSVGVKLHLFKFNFWICSKMELVIIKLLNDVLIHFLQGTRLVYSFSWGEEFNLSHARATSKKQIRYRRRR